MALCVHECARFSAPVLFSVEISSFSYYHFGLFFGRLLGSGSILSPLFGGNQFPNDSYSIDDDDTGNKRRCVCVCFE